MKYTTLLLIINLFAFNLSAQFGNVSNGNFEMWQDSVIQENPIFWSTSNQIQDTGKDGIVKSTDAFNGDYAARIQVIEEGYGNTSSGYIYHGTMDQATITGGIDYTSSFDAISFHYRSDLLEGDTLYVLFGRFIDGQVYQLDVIPVLGGQNLDWAPALINVEQVPQDQVYLQFIIGDFNSTSNPNVDSWVELDNIQLLSGGAPADTTLPNHSFEDWEASTVEVPFDWYSMNIEYGGYGYPNLFKSTHAVDGLYSAQLETIEGNNNILPSYASVGAIDFGATFLSTPIPYNASPTYFSFQYHHDSPSDCYAYYELNLFIDDFVETHYGYLPRNDDFEVLGFDLNLSSEPDSMGLYFLSGESLGSKFYVDGVQFYGGNVGIESILDDQIKIYPNPVNDILHISFEEFPDELKIINALGQTVYNQGLQPNIQTIDVSELDPGIYLLIARYDHTTVQKRIIIE